MEHGKEHFSAKVESAYRSLLELGIDDQEWQAVGCVGLGNALLTRGDVDGAEAAYRKAIQLYERLGSPEGQAKNHDIK